MDIAIGPLPESVVDMLNVLKGAGFELAMVRGSGTANCLIEVRGAECIVRVSADRGQWWIELGGPTASGLFDPDVWIACLDDIPIAREPMPLEAQVAFVRSRWRETVAESAPSISACLERTRSLRARERLGLPPTIGEAL